jgi:hypothetical protein
MFRVASGQCGRRVNIERQHTDPENCVKVAMASNRL